MALYRVLVADDSAFMRKIISDMINADKQFEIVATASNGRQAVDATVLMKPDVIMMDLEMPEMNGLEALVQVMRKRPTPTVMMSSTSDDGTRMTIQALQYGAFDFIRKPAGPTSPDIKTVGDQMLEKLRIAVESNVAASIAATDAEDEARPDSTGDEAQTAEPARKRQTAEWQEWQAAMAAQMQSDEAEIIKDKPVTAELTAKKSTPALPVEEEQPVHAQRKDTVLPPKTQRPPEIPAVRELAPLSQSRTFEPEKPRRAAVPPLEHKPVPSQPAPETAVTPPKPEPKKALEPPKPAASAPAAAIKPEPKPAPRPAVSSQVPTAKPSAKPEVKPEVKPAAASTSKPIPIAADLMDEPIAPRVKKQTAKQTNFRHLVAIGTSTGGPRALHEVITALPENLPAPVLVVQHMPPKFTHSLAQRLDSFSALQVTEAVNNERVYAGVVYIAPGGLHMELAKDGQGYYIRLTEQPPRGGHRPSVDVMFESCAPFTELQRHSVIMTGMGSDGAKGMKTLMESGGKTAIAESEETCVVYGMPRSAVENGAAKTVVPLGRIAGAIVDAVMK
ncbi:chemotaxis protein CheB [Paenibacillus xanthanilyticus]|uniref:Protein-glutamate methylesterase/protein-glutamine glutaminase n=1 Tax=Paenibacillus xanthanilyticus TaxID=1783531 RepID=A0ABV8KCF1_9BACL